MDMVLHTPLGKCWRVVLGHRSTATGVALSMQRDVIVVEAHAASRGFSV